MSTVVTEGNAAGAEEVTKIIPQEAIDLVDKGRAAEDELDRWTAIEHFQAAVDMAPDYLEACFRLAYNLDLVGEEEEAIEHYETCVADPLPAMNALINLAILYEDMGDFHRSEKCLRQVVSTSPDHVRANLYMKDVLASKDMIIDEDSDRLREEHNILLETPVTDFELSARTINCLKKMNIRTVGDLLRTTEAELMSYKNFGETSLGEIKSLLAQKGLRLGQALEQQHQVARAQVYQQLKESGNEAVLDMPVSDLNLSVRARRALDLLNIHNVADLISRTEAELLGIKNFGATSLNEIKQKLTEKGLGLRQLEP